MTRAWGGIGAVVGGALWTVHATVLAARPPGCVRDACHVPGAASRPSEDLALVFLVAVALLAVAATTLGRGREQQGRAPLRVGAILLWAGVACLVLGLALNALLPGDSPLWWMHDTDSLGRLLPVAGSCLVGVGLLRRGSESSWAGVALAVTALVSVPFNAQDDRVLLNVPLGLAWVVAGSWWSLQRRRALSLPPPGPSSTTPRQHAPSDGTERSAPG